MENRTCEESDVVLRWINYLVPALLLMVGLVTNTLSLCVLMKSDMHRTSIMVLFCILVGFDNVCIVVGLLPYWIEHAFEFNLRTNTLVTCRLLKFFITFSTDFSNWVLVAINVDRCLSVSFHQVAIRFCTKRHVVKYVIILVIVLFFVNGHLLFNMDLQPNNCLSTSCVGRNIFTRFVWPWVDLCVYCLVPTLIMVICNTIIVTTVVKSRNKVLSNMNRSIKLEGRSADTPRDFTLRSKHKISTLTRTLFGLDLMFLLLTGPIVVHQIYESYGDMDTFDLRSANGGDYFQSFANILEFANHSIHFFIYGTTIPKFRHTFRNRLHLLRVYCKSYIFK